MQDAGLLMFNHEGEFQRAWADPGNTRLELPPVDVNRVLAEHYRTGEPLEEPVLGSVGEVNDTPPVQWS